MRKLLEKFLLIVALGVISAAAQISYQRIYALSSNVAQYVGKQYVYTDVIKQFTQPYFPPFPYRDGRVRDGKYKASETALNKYLQEVHSYFGKKFTVVRFEPGWWNIPGAVMACENGDTLFFQGNVIDRQFVNAEYYDSQVNNAGAKLTIVGKALVDTTSFLKDLLNKFYACKNLKDEKYTYDMPVNTEWKIKSVIFDTTYIDIGVHSVTNDAYNWQYDRFKYTIENKEYGIFECFPNNHLKDFNIVK